MGIFFSSNPFPVQTSDLADDAVTTAKIDAPIVPIGGIIAWNKTFANTPDLPTGFLELDGSVIDDADSPYNTQTLPDLNGNNNFLRGNDTSIGTGGSATHNHQWYSDEYTSWAANGSTTEPMIHDAYTPLNTTLLWDMRDQNTDLYTKNTTSIPPYFNVVWIMRIK